MMLTFLSYFFTTLVVFAIMEGVTWFTHKYIMHGFLWYLHEDHHKPKYQGVFEKNDLFFVIFSIPSILLFYVGINPLNHFFFVGLGIFFYGIAYFFVHDIIIHQRIKSFKFIHSPYLKALRKGHKMHHKHLEKTDGECFGMLFVPFKYFKESFKK